MTNPTNGTATTTGPATEGGTQLSPEAAEVLAALRALPADEVEAVLAAYEDDPAPAEGDEETNPGKLADKISRRGL